MVTEFAGHTQAVDHHTAYLGLTNPLLWVNEQQEKQVPGSSKFNFILADMGPDTVVAESPMIWTAAGRM